jgi:hypothetical protein
MDEEFYRQLALRVRDPAEQALIRRRETSFGLADTYLASIAVRRATVAASPCPIRRGLATHEEAHSGRGLLRRALQTGFHRAPAGTQPLIWPGTLPKMQRLRSRIEA